MIGDDENKGKHVGRHDINQALSRSKRRGDGDDTDMHQSRVMAEGTSQTEPMDQIWKELEEQDAAMEEKKGFGFENVRHMSSTGTYPMAIVPPQVHKG